MTQANHANKKLQKFIGKRNEWFTAYDVVQGEPNSILRQIHGMLLTEMSYRVAIQEHREQNANGISSPPIMGFLLDSGYFSSQILAIRKLLDKGTDVLSLRRVLDDIQKNKKLIPREIFVSFDGTPYDIVPFELSTPGLQPMDSPFSMQMKCRMRHERFDGLSRVSPDKRTSKDLIHDSIFERLEAWLEEGGVENLRKISNKYVAHAADARSRADVVGNLLAFDEIEAAQRAIIRVTQAIFDIILSSDTYSPVVPMVPSGYFGNVWDGNSMVVSTTRMQARWDSLEEIRNEWSKGIEEELIA
jgi:hypothetical protein